MSKKKKTIEELVEETIVPVEEQPYELPENWRWVKLLNGYAECLDKYRKPVNAEARAKRVGNIPYYGATGQVGWIDDYLTDEELVLLGEDGVPFLDPFKNKAYIIREKAWVNNHAHILRSNFGSEGNLFLLHYLNNFNFNGYVSGTTRLKLTQKKMAIIPVPLPPFNEQKRIADKVERLLSKIEEAKQLIEEAKETFELRRAAILDKAFRGDLTRKWREENQCDKLEPIEQSGNIGPFKLPHGWEWKKLGEIGELQRGKSKHRPRNDPKLFGGDYPFIQTGDIARSSDYVEDFSQTLSEFGYNQSKLFPIGTVCITIAANIADTAILKFPCCFPDSVVGFVPFKEIVSSEFVHYYISTIKNDLEHYAPATAQKNINLKILNEVLVPVPSLKEHDVIMHKIKNLLDKEYEASQYLSLEKSIELLKKSLLSKAFRGELGTNDLIEESCIELLKEVLQQNLN